MDLRQHDASGGILRRGLLHVQMCYTNCTPPLEGPTVAAANSWNVFGAGPVLSFGSQSRPEVDQYYSLVGNHNAESPFATLSGGIDNAGELTKGDGTLVWAQRPTTSPDVRLTEYTVAYPDPGTVFGMAYDFDIGFDAGDDIGGFDAVRGLVFAYDKSGASGILIRRGGTNAINAVTQYGSKRLAPVSLFAVRNAQRDAGAHMLSGTDDVQFLVSTSPTAQATTYQVYLIRAATVTLLKTLADEIISAKK